MRGACAAALIVALSGCSLLNPHVRGDLSLKDLHKADAADPNREPTEFAGDLPQAIRYADSVREGYFDAVTHQSYLRNVTGLTLLPLTATALYLGITSSSGFSRDVIAALGIGGAGLFSAGLLLENTALREIYLNGYLSVGCAVLRMTPWLMPKDDFDRLGPALDEMPFAIRELQDRRNELQAELDRGGGASDLRSRAVELIGRSDQLLEETRELLGSGRSLEQGVLVAGRELVEGVDRIKGEISKQIAEEEGNLDSVLTIVNGMGGLAPSFTTVPDELKRKEDDGLGDVQGLVPGVPAAPGVPAVPVVDPLLESFRALQAAYDELLLQVAIVESVVERSRQSIEGIEDFDSCLPEAVENALRTNPAGPFKLTAKQAVTQTFLIEGGRAPYVAELLKDPTTGVTVSQPTPFASRVRIETTEDVDPVTGQILITDGSQRSLVVEFEVEAAAGAGATGSGETNVVGTQSEDPTIGFQGDEIGLLANDRQKAERIQSALCVKVDGKFGDMTRAQIRAFQTHRGEPVTSHLTAAQIDILAAAPTCQGRGRASFYENSLSDTKLRTIRSQVGAPVVGDSWSLEDDGVRAKIEACKKKQDIINALGALPGLDGTVLRDDGILRRPFVAALDAFVAANGGASPCP